MRQSPIFARTYDFLRWLLPATIKFPRQQRFILAEALQRKGFELQEALIEAAQGSDTPAALRRADCALTALRTYLRLAQDLNLLSHNRYEHAARMLEEIGRLLGGWLKAQNVQ
jgi:hypothetical protein